MESISIQSKEERWGDKSCRLCITRLVVLLTLSPPYVKQMKNAISHPKLQKSYTRCNGSKIQIQADLIITSRLEAQETNPIA